MSPDDPDEVHLILNGTDVSGFDTIQIDMAIDTLADSFSLSAPFDPEKSSFVKCIEPYKYQEAKIYLGDTSIKENCYLTGTLDKVDFPYTPSDRIVTLSGRSKTGILADCSADAVAASQMSAPDGGVLLYASIARQICRPLGITIRDDDDEPGSRNICEARAEWGQTCFDYLHKLAAPHNLLLNSAYDGRLVLTHGDALVNYITRCNLVEGMPELLSISSSFDSSKRFSVYKVGTQFCDAPDTTGEAYDPYIAPFRPRYKACEEAGLEGQENNDNADAVAARMMAEAIASSLNISVTMDGWRMPKQSGVDQSTGLRWSERKIVTLKAPSVYLFKSARYVISACSLKYDKKNGRTTELRLVPPEVYSQKLTKGKKKKIDLW